MAELQPLYGTVVLRPDEPEEETSEAQLYLPEKAREQPISGVIVAIDPAWSYPNGIQVGDRVLHKKHAGLEVNHEGERLLVMEPADLLVRLASTDAG